MRIPTLAVSLAALSFAIAACNSSQMNGSSKTQPDMNHHDVMMGMHEWPWSNIHEAVAVMYPTKGNTASGAIYFDEVKPTTNPPGSPTVTPPGSYLSMIHIHGSITGLAPNSTHACHIHEFGDATSSDGMSTGSHYDPEGTHHHGAPDSAEHHHAGDFGNITADASGTATIDLTVSGISIAGVKDPILGRAVIIHAKPDDFSQPVGNAGGRIAVGIIGIAKAKP